MEPNDANFGGGATSILGRIGRQHLLSEKIHFLLIGLLLPSSTKGFPDWYSELVNIFHVAFIPDECLNVLKRFCPWNPKATARGCRGWWKELRDGPFLSFHWSHPQHGRARSSGYLLCGVHETLGYGGSWSQELNLAHRSNSFYPQAPQGVTFPVRWVPHLQGFDQLQIVVGDIIVVGLLRLGLSTRSKIAGYPIKSINLVLNGQFDGTNILNLLDVSWVFHLTTLLGKEIGESSSPAWSPTESTKRNFYRNSFAGKLEEYVSWNPTIHGIQFL